MQLCDKANKLRGYSIFEEDFPKKGARDAVKSFDQVQEKDI